MSVLGTGMLWFDFGESQQQERPMEGLPRGFPLRHAWRSRIFHQAGPWLSTPVNKMLWVLSKKMMKVCYCIHVVSFMIVLHLSWFQLVLLATKCFVLLYTFKCALFACGILLNSPTLASCKFLEESTCHLKGPLLDVELRTWGTEKNPPESLWWMNLLPTDVVWSHTSTRLLPGCQFGTAAQPETKDSTVGGRKFDWKSRDIRRDSMDFDGVRTTCRLQKTKENLIWWPSILNISSWLHMITMIFWISLGFPRFG